MDKQLVCTYIEYREQLSVYFAEADAQVCQRISQTCCPRNVEISMEAAALKRIKNTKPEVSAYLNESDHELFSHYSK